MSRNIIVKVPEKETYYFCKRMFFTMFGEPGLAFANAYERRGWVGYPYYLKSDDLILLFFAEDLKDYRDILSHYPSNVVYNYTKIIITSLDIGDDNLKIYDISNLKDYYETELDMKEFISKVLNETDNE